MTDEGINLNTKFDSSRDFRFRVVSYNILDQNLLNNHMYLYEGCNRRHLDMYARWNLMEQEILDVQPDVICIQEMNVNVASRICNFGYHFLYMKRKNNKTDGCAIYIRKSRFRFDFSNTQIFTFSPSHAPKVLNDNVAIIASLIPIEKPDVRVIVSNTHLLFNPKRGDTKLLQCMTLLSKLHAVKQSSPPDSFVIMCGDFNMFPRCPLYQFMTNAPVDFQHLCKTEVTGQLEGRSPSDRELGCSIIPDELCFDRTSRVTEPRKKNQPKETHKDGIMSHQLKLQSVYNHGSPTPSPFREVTTHHGRVNETVDYIFYEPRQPNSRKTSAGDPSKPRVPHALDLVLTSRLRLLSAQQMDTFGTMPNASCSSDHLLIAAEFCLM